MENANLKMFDYPIQADYLLRKKRFLKRELLSRDIEWIDKKIAILCGSTADEIKDQMELFLLKEGIRPTFYLSEYNKYWEDAVFDNNELELFKPDIIFIHTTSRNILKWPNVSMGHSEIEELLNNQFDYLKSMWESLKRKYKCPIIQNNFEKPVYRILGNQDIANSKGKSNYIHKLNSLIYEYAENNQGLFIHDIDYLSSEYGLSKWLDSKYWYAYKYALSLQAIPDFAYSLTRIIKSIYGKNKKVLTVDLDNTLWGGVIGDDGVNNIVLGQETSKGQSFYYFQKYIKDLMQIGIVLAINSKNDYNNAIEGLNHPSSLVNEKDFACIKANWNSKDINLIDISHELNLGLDSFVFIDDNPAEREIVKAQLPMVEVPEIGQPEYYFQFIDRAGYFEITSLTNDDLDRNKMYKENVEREKLKQNYTDYNEYLRNLEMKATISSFEPVYIQRIAQLTNKTNQFNVTTKRYSESDMEAILHNKSYITLYGRLVDKFGDNGIVTVVMGKKKGENLYLDLWLMSCRVLKRGLEYAMLDELVKVCAQSNVKTIFGYYYPTLKNGMVRNLFADLGFQKVDEDVNGNTVWKYDILNHKNLNNIIEIIK